MIDTLHLDTGVVTQIPKYGGILLASATIVLISPINILLLLQINRLLLQQTMAAGRMTGMQTQVLLTISLMIWSI
jgi:hypothetical protein